MIRSFLFFGDTISIPHFLPLLCRYALRGIVGASLRPEQHRRLRSIARKHRLPFLIQPRPDSPDWPSFLQRVREFAPELMLVHSYSMRLPADLLRISSRGGVNIHWALLPRYRGCSPTQWAMIRGESQTGVTLHRMSQHFDAGAILAQRTVRMGLDETWKEVQDKLIHSTRELLRASLPALFRETLRAKPQNPQRASYFHRRHPEDGEFDGSTRVWDIYNLIRALVRPLPGAFYVRGSRRVWIKRFLSLNEVAALKGRLETLKRRSRQMTVPLLLFKTSQRRELLRRLPRAWRESRGVVTYGLRGPGHSPLIAAAHLWIRPDDFSKAQVRIHPLLPSGISPSSLARASREFMSMAKHEFRLTRLQRLS